MLKAKYHLPEVYLPNSFVTKQSCFFCFKQQLGEKEYV